MVRMSVSKTEGGSSILSRPANLLKRYHIKKFILAILLVGLFTSCEDELISSVYDRNSDQDEVYVENPVSDSAKVDGTNKEQELYPIGFSVSVDDYNNKTITI